MKLYDGDNSGAILTRYYTGRTTSGYSTFTFDFDDPYHCVSATFSGCRTTMLYAGDDVTSDVRFKLLHRNSSCLNYIASPGELKFRLFCRRNALHKICYLFVRFISIVIIFKGSDYGNVGRLGRRPLWYQRISPTGETTVRQPW